MRPCSRMVRGALAFALLAGGAAADERAAQAGDRAEDARIAALEQRIAELEAQNQAILELLRQLRPEAGGVYARGAALPRIEKAVLAVPSPEPSTASAEPEGSAAPLPKQVQIGQSRLGFYGFVRLDAIFDDSRSSEIQTPTFIPAEDPGLGTEESDASFNFHPRLTRFGMNYDGPEIGGGVRLGGKIEVDFQNGGRESRQILRLRHGFLKLDWGKASLLAGQTWDLISPLYPTVNADTLMWNTGNLGDRRPQVRARIESGSGLSFEGGIGLGGAISPQDLDGDGVRDADDAAMPHVQARLGYAGKSWALGLSGHRGREETRGAIAGHHRFDTSSLSLDFKGSAGKLTVQGEAWTGRNLADFRGGIGQGVNVSTGEEIGSSGGWLELGLALSERYSLYVGYTVDDPDDADVPAGGRIKNDALYLVNRFRFGPAFLVGFDYLYWTTDFQGLDSGTDNRFNLYLVYTF